MQLQSTASTDPNNHNACEGGESMLRHGERSGPHEFEDNVDGGDLRDLLRGDHFVGAEGVEGLTMRRVARYRGDVGPQGIGNLHGGRADSTGGPGDQDPLSGRETGLAHQGVIGGEVGLGEAPGFGPRDVGRNGEHIGRRHQHVRGVTTPTHNGAYPVPQHRVFHPVADGNNLSGDLEPGDVGGPARGSGVVARDLQDVRGVKSRGPGGDENLAGGRGGRGAFAQCERSIFDGDHVHGDHPKGGGRERSRYIGRMTLYSTPLHTLAGEPTTLAAYEGQAVLIVNVASKCGLTPQYEGLEALQRTYGDRGFTVLGFPCNQFMGQEPGTPEEIATFCSATYGVTFPLFEKIEVNGEGRHPLYAELCQTADDEGYSGDIRWNFEKFLVSPDGLVQRFSPSVTPDDPTLVAAVEGSLR